MTVSLVRMAFVPMVAAALAGCGSLDGHTSAPSALAMVQGQLSFGAGAPSMPDHIHIAVIWQTTVPGQFNVAQDLPVQPVFPSQYVLHLTEPPPEPVIVRLPSYPEYGSASGVVVAYEDLNQNGRLDLVPDDAGAFLDRIVATSPTLALMYLDSTTGSFPPFFMPTPGHGTPTLGYNLLTQDCAPLDGSVRGPDGHVCLWNAFLPMSTPYDLPFSSDPKLNSLMCQTTDSSSVSSGTGFFWNVNNQGPPPGGYSAAGAQGLTCSADGSSYKTHSCRAVGGLCSNQTACMDAQVVLGGAATPVGWPCL